MPAGGFCEVPIWGLFLFGGCYDCGRFFQLPSGGEFPVFCGSHWFQRADPAPGVPDRGGDRRGGLLSAAQRQGGLEANCHAAAHVSRADGGEPAVQYLRRAGAVSCVRKTLHGGGAALRRGHRRGVSGDDALVRLLQRGHDQRQVHKPVRESDPGNFIAAGDGAADDPQLYPQGGADHGCEKVRWPRRGGEQHHERKTHQRNANIVRPDGLGAGGQSS